MVEWYQIWLLTCFVDNFGAFLLFAFFDLFFCSSVSRLLVPAFLRYQVHFIKMLTSIIYVIESIWLQEIFVEIGRSLFIKVICILIHR